MWKKKKKRIRIQKHHGKRRDKKRREEGRYEEYDIRRRCERVFAPDGRVIAPEVYRNVVVCTTVLKKLETGRGTRTRGCGGCVSLFAFVVFRCNNDEKELFVFSNEFHKETYVGEAKKGESVNDRTIGRYVRWLSFTRR